jgi:hypothetical protein
MPKIEYKVKRFKEAKLRTIHEVNRIIRKYQLDGFDLTLRQVYYQFISHDLFPDDRRWRQNDNGKWVRDPNGTKNADPNYKWLGDAISDGRLAGLIDWNSIVDRLREKDGNQHWDSPTEIVEMAAKAYRIDLWADQPRRIEVWVEKEALIEIISRAARDVDVDWFSCKGYASLSAMWRAAQRLKEYEGNEQETIILHLGDHDPSGIDMTRDIQDRLHMFGADTEVRRIALTMDQIEEQDPPPNPAKASDPRGTGYVDAYGTKSWELDALEPRYLVDLITREVEYLRDDELWTPACEKEQLERDLIAEAVEDIKKKLDKGAS